MKVISWMYMSRHNFWCMTRGDSSHLNFQVQKVDWGPSGRQNWRKTMEFWKIFYIHFIRDPKGITYVAFFLKIESHAKMRLPKLTVTKLLRQRNISFCQVKTHTDVKITFLGTTLLMASFWSLMWGDMARYHLYKFHNWHLCWVSI